MSLMQAYEKLAQGLDILASDGPVRDRLLRAFLKALSDIPEDALPPEAQPRWRRVWQSVTAAHGIPGETRLVSSIRALSEEEATIVAGHIVTIHAIVQLAIPTIRRPGSAAQA